MPIKVTGKIQNAHFGDKFENDFSGANVGAMSQGQNSIASQTSGVQLPTQAQYRSSISHAQAALVADQDAIDAAGRGVFEALHQFLRIARDIQVEQRSLASLQSTMKATLDEVWAQQVAAGMKPQALPESLGVIRAIAASPLMAGVIDKLISGK
jgi:hypothetical protein